MESGKMSRLVTVLMFPWLAHGHISPYLELAKKLAKRNFRIHICSTVVNITSFREKLSPEYSPSIQFVELHLPSLPELPPHYHTTKGLPPHLMSILKVAFDMASPSFYNILKSSKPDLLVYDLIQPWAPVLASSLGIPAVQFMCSSVSLFAFIVHDMKNPGHDDFPFPASGAPNYLQYWQEYDNGSTVNGLKEGDRFLQCFERSSNIMLVKSFRELEGEYMDYLSFLLKKKVVPVGPLVDQDPTNGDDKMEVIKWLDKKKPSSTVFVSFGSEYFLSKEERIEIAHGLELSNVNFIWVVRFPVGENINLEEALPEGYIKNVSNKGLVLEGWAPQAKILAHSSIGGFVSHCGWSSIMESLKFGVPIIAIPMHLDQPMNAILVKDVGVGIEVNRNKTGGLEREEIAKTTREVVAEKGGEGVRSGAREMSDYIRGKDSKFSQQELPACKPLLTPGLVIASFTFIGLVFMPIGLASLFASRNVVEIVERYDTDCVPSSFANDMVEYIRSDATDKTCLKRVTVPKHMKSPIFVYYQLDNFYQNHRRYVRSRNDKQLESKAYEGNVQNCKPEDLSSNGKPIVPCGLVAWSLFNDTYKFSTKEKVIEVNKKNIAWKSDKERKFGSDVYPQNFQKGGLIGGGKLNDSIPLSEQEDLMVWMRTAALPTFRKLYGRIEEDLEENDEIEVEIQNNYNSYGYGGKKQLILSTSSWIGGKNDFLGVAYLTVGGMCFSLAVSFIFIYVFKPRPLGDPSYLSWNKNPAELKK